MRETNVTRGVIRMVQEAGGKAVKLHTGQFQEVGTPDILASIPGVGVMLVECKTPEGDLSRMQRYRLQEWARAGVWTGAVWSVNGFRNMLAEIRAGGPPRYMGYYT